MIRLVKPTPAYEDQVMAAKQAFLDAGESFDGCAGLENCTTYAEWCDFEGRLSRLYGAGYVPSSVYLAVRTEDDRVVGIIDCREYLSDFLLRYGGHIGYSIFREERRKGYAREMLRLALETYRERGVDRVLITCDKENEASRRTILGNGGVLENEVPDEAQICSGGLIQRYLIALE